MTKTTLSVTSDERSAIVFALSFLHANLDYEVEEMYKDHTKARGTKRLGWKKLVALEENIDSQELY